MRNQDKDQVFRETYKIDESTDLYMIEIAVDHYANIFNPWDSSPINRKEVDPSLEHYLVNSSDDVSFQHSIEFYIVILKEIRNEKIENQVKKGIRNHFTFKVYLIQKELNQNNRRVLYFILTGFLLLGLETMLTVDSSRILPSTLEQGLVISGWVFIWEAVSRLFFKNRDLYHRYRTYQRLQNTPVIFGEVENIRITY